MRRMPLLVLAIALVLALAGCGEDKPTKKLGTLGDDTETSATPDPPTATPDAGTTRYHGGLGLGLSIAGVAILLFSAALHVRQRDAVPA